MTLRELPAGAWSALLHPRPTVRWRLALLYGGLFLISGAALLAVTYTLVDHATLTDGSRLNFAPVQAIRRAGGAGASWSNANRHVRQATVPPPVTKLLRSKSGRFAIRFVGSNQRISDLHQLVVESAIALAVMAVISAALGWMIAGRVLRPLRTITAATQQISDVNLHERLAMPGPRDELRQLADTIDGLLGRLEAAFEAQRRFVANASHELRTPLTTTRALLEMVMTDPHAGVKTFREACRQALEESEQQERLIDALLTLAQGQRVPEGHDRLDLAVIADEVRHSHEGDAAARDLRVDVSLSSAALMGDQRLVTRLVSNLVDNAIRHNTPHGWVRMQTATTADHAVLLINNTGAPVPADQIQRLLQPFQRLAPDRIGHADGLGLGLSIVAAIATAHRASLDVHPGREGGLSIAVRFPRDSRRQPAHAPPPVAGLPRVAA